MYSRRMQRSEVRRLQEQLKSLERRSRKEWVTPDGLTQTMVPVLGSIARRPGGSQPGIIADELSMTTSNVAAALRQLESRGLILRSRDEHDSRRTNLVLTEAGRAVVGDSRNDRDEWLSAAIDARLDADEQALLIEAGRLLERLSKFDAPTVAASDHVAS
jgi:DNA-binding MarR family transcriptional regulator